MDFTTAMNRMKTRLRNWFFQDHWFKKIVPEKVKHMLSRNILKAIESKTGKPEPYEAGAFPEGINLYGFFRAENGLAQGVKHYARAIETAGIPHCFLNTDFLGWLGQDDRSWDGKLTAENRYAVNVVHINPDQWMEAVGMFPRAHFDRHYNIGVFLWELERIPRHWIPIFDQVDEIWAPSEFVASAVRKATEKPVTVIPYGIETPVTEGLTRKNFGLPEDDFLVLLMYNTNSYATRKNPGAAIRAFKEAFGEHPAGAKLVIKINNAIPEEIEDIRRWLPDPDSYVLMTERMDRERMNAMIRLCDAYISLHRSEGFGLIMAEAMSLGVPVVATNWSSNTEFMPEDAACMVGYEMVPVGNGYQFEAENEGLTWAEADSHQAAEYLRRLKEDPEYRERIGQAGQKVIRERLTTEKCAELIRERLKEVLQ